MALEYWSKSLLIMSKNPSTRSMLSFSALAVRSDQADTKIGDVYVETAISRSNCTFYSDHNTKEAGLCEVLFKNVKKALESH